MKSIYKCFLVSFIIHVFFIIGLFFSSLFVNENKNYFTVINKGSSFSVNVVSKPFVKTSKSQQLTNSKQIDEKQVLQYTVNEDVNLNIVEKQWKKESVDKNNFYTGSGGVDGEGAEVVPVIKNNNIINFIPPEYPRSCLALGQEGTVIVRLLVNDRGQIIKNQLYRSSGHKVLDYAVLKVANIWTVNIPPLETSWVEVVVNFIIK